MNALSRSKLELACAGALARLWRGAAWRLGGLIAVVALLQACAGPQLQVHSHQTFTPQCSAWWPALDRAVQEAGVGDAQAALIEGFAGLRTTRMLSALRSEAALSPQAFEAWLQRAAQEDRLARSAEIHNLPASALASLSVVSPAAALERTDHCREQGLDALQGALQERLLERAEFASSYSIWRRAAGCTLWRACLFLPACSAGKTNRWRR